MKARKGSTLTYPLPKHALGFVLGMHSGDVMSNCPVTIGTTPCCSVHPGRC